MPNELQIPNEVLNDDKSVELLKVWVARGDQHMSIRKDAWADPAAWEILLVDLARLIADSYDDKTFEGFPIVERIRQGFDAEWHEPTE